MFAKDRSHYLTCWKWYRVS